MTTGTGDLIKRLEAGGVRKALATLAASRLRDRMEAVTGNEAHSILPEIWPFIHEIMTVADNANDLSTAADALEAAERERDELIEDVNSRGETIVAQGDALEEAERVIAPIAIASRLSNDDVDRARDWIARRRHRPAEGRG